MLESANKPDANAQTPASQTTADSPRPAPAATAPGTTPAAPDLNAAVKRCCSAYHRAVAAAGGERAAGPRDAAELAFKMALPFVGDRDSIHDFIACVTHGMLLKVFWKDEGPRLIAAAKAALAALPLEPRPGPRPAGRPKSPQPW